jgi:hypothetical protein
MRRKGLASASLWASHDTPRRTSDMAAEKMWVMTSLGERAGVRGNGTHEMQSVIRGQFVFLVACFYHLVHIFILES